MIDILIKLLLVGTEAQPPVGAIPDPESTGVVSGDLLAYVQSIINWALGLLGILVFCLILYAGFMYLTAGDSQEQTKSAISILRNTLIGAILIFFTFVLSNAIIGFVFQV